MCQWWGVAGPTDDDLRYDSRQLSRIMAEGENNENDTQEVLGGKPSKYRFPQ
jgi:hypothetical protein